eukprot:GILJ01036104.1.p1 GENE.GILJ01036104.1~~GILJ01036104.1.p1  ORF type:complete len:250 (+),score=52.79 GILJ01036104.1:1-750(+)
MVASASQWRFASGEVPPVASSSPSVDPPVQVVTPVQVVLTPVPVGNKKVVQTTTLHGGATPKTVIVDLSSALNDEQTRARQAIADSKPFITPQMLKSFSFSLAVGASVIAAVHYILSASIADNYDEELAVIRRVTRDTSEADKLPAKPQLPQFVSPSSYSQLKKKMEEENRIARERFLDAENRKDTPVLHQELWQRAMQAWNNGLSNVEQSGAAASVQFQDWRLKQVKKNLKSILERQQLELVEIKSIE